MAFPNKNYTLGSGKIYFGKFLEGTRTPEPFRYFGNTPAFNTSSESETLDHFDADNGARTKDDSALLQLNRSGSLITDHISPPNLALWFLGEDSIVTQSSASAQTATFTAAEKGRMYLIGATTNNPSGLRGLTLTSIVDDTTPTPVPLVAGVDYVFDGAAGTIEFLDGSTIVDGVKNVVLTYGVSATTYNRIMSGSSAQIEGALLFKANNAKGLNMDYLFPYVQLQPDGDFELKSEEWQQLGFTFQALKRDDVTEVLYVNGRPGQGV